MALALCGSDQLLDWDRPTQHLCTQVLNVPEPGVGVAWPGGLAFEAFHNFAVEAAPVCLSALLQAAQQVFWNVVVAMAQTASSVNPTFWQACVV